LLLGSAACSDSGAGGAGGTAGWTASAAEIADSPDETKVRVLRSADEVAALNDEAVNVEGRNFDLDDHDIAYTVVRTLPGQCSPGEMSITSFGSDLHANYQTSPCTEPETYRFFIAVDARDGNQPFEHLILNGFVIPIEEPVDMGKASRIGDEGSFDRSSTSASEHAGKADDIAVHVLHPKAYDVQWVVTRTLPGRCLDRATASATVFGTALYMTVGTKPCDEAPAYTFRIAADGYDASDPPRKLVLNGFVIPIEEAA
jgi:hypothetical protein